MKKVILAITLLCPLSLWSAITYVGGATAACASATTCSVTYSPASGDVVVGCLITGNSISSPTAVDSGSNALTLGSNNLAGPGAAAFSYVAGSGITSFTFSWTTARPNAVAVASYHTVSSVVGSPTGGTNSGTGTAISVAPTASETNDFAVSCMGPSTFKQQTIVTGNLRQESHVTSTGLAIADALSTGATSTTVATSVGTSSSWVAAAVILRTSGTTTIPGQFPRIQ